jgi:leucine dehydrogenase
MSVIAQRTRHVAGLARSRGGSGDPSPFTALGVEYAIRACCERTFSTASLRGRYIGVIGLGHVGSRVAKRCARGGAKLVVTDVNPDKRELARQLGARWVARDEALAVEADVLVPCALGGLLDDESVPRLQAPIIAGAANNQLADDVIADLLAARGILWAPDFVVNAGGLINVAEELYGYDPAAVRRRVRGIADTLRQIFDDAEAIGATPLTAAMELARRRLAVVTIPPVR